MHLFLSSRASPHVPVVFIQTHTHACSANPSRIPRGLSLAALARHPPMRHIPRVVHAVLTVMGQYRDVKHLETVQQAADDETGVYHLVLLWVLYAWLIR